MDVQRFNLSTSQVDANFETVPQMSSHILDIYEKHAPNWEKSNKWNLPLQDLPLRRKVENLNELHQALNEAKKNETLHKVLSIALLAISVTIIAVAIILAITVQPELILVFMGTFVPAIIAFVLSDVDDFFVPILSEGYYIYKSFHRVDTIEQETNKNIEYIDNANKKIKKLLSHKEEIEKGIRSELEKVDIINLDPSPDWKHVQNLREALKELQKAEFWLLQQK